MTTHTSTVRTRAAASLGTSSDAIYARARDLLLSRGAKGHVADIGCGRGALRRWLGGIATGYTGVDAVRFDGFPAEAAFLEADLDTAPLPLGDASVDVAVALETIEHLENPRRFVRELVRVTRPGGALLLSTPNQTSALSLLTLAARGEFNAFRSSDYPAHITALLPIDLQRIALECGLESIEIAWSAHGRLPLTGRRVPAAMSRWFPRAFSDHVFLFGRVRQ